MNEVWVVLLCIPFEGYHFPVAFSSKEKAEAYIDSQGDKETRGGDYYVIEKLIVDEKLI